MAKKKLLAHPDQTSIPIKKHSNTNEKLVDSQSKYKSIHTPQHIFAKKLHGKILTQHCQRKTCQTRNRAKWKQEHWGAWGMLFSHWKSCCCNIAKSQINWTMSGEVSSHVTQHSTLTTRGHNLIHLILPLECGSNITFLEEELFNEWSCSWEIGWLGWNVAWNLIDGDVAEMVEFCSNSFTHGGNTKHSCICKVLEWGMAVELATTAELLPNN